MWDYVDNELKKYKREYDKETLTMMDEIQNIFNETKDLEARASKTDLNRFKRRISDNHVYLSDYGKYKANRYLKRHIIRYSDILWFSLFMAYANRQYKAYKKQLDMLNRVAEHTYNQEVNDLSRIFRDKKKLNSIKLVEKYLREPNSKGYIWSEYLDANTEYNTTQLYNKAVQNIRSNKPLDVYSKEFKKLIIKQNNREICINDKKTSGAIDNELIYIANESKLQAYKDYGIKKAKFIAVMDKKTTKMCDSLDGQIFSVNDWNRFYRYSAYDNKDVYYTVKGLVIGVNLPPINNHYHACRSTITYQLDKQTEKDIRRSLNAGN